MTRQSPTFKPWLDEVHKLDIAALRIEWSNLFDRPAPRRISQDLLIRAVAHRIQELESGGLRPATLRRLQRLTRDIRAGKKISTALQPRLRPGVRLMREWKGKSEIVEVLADGFSWRGNRYASLSAVARAMTGSHWSGLRFFGLLDKRRPKGPTIPADPLSVWDSDNG